MGSMRAQHLQQGLLHGSGVLLLAVAVLVVLWRQAQAFSHTRLATLALQRGQAHLQQVLCAAGLLHLRKPTHDLDTLQKHRSLLSKHDPCMLILTQVSLLPRHSGTGLSNHMASLHDIHSGGPSQPDSTAKAAKQHEVCLCGHPRAHDVQR